MKQCCRYGLKRKRVLPIGVGGCWTRFLLLASFLAVIAAPPAGVQPAAQGEEAVGLETLRVVGSRSLGRSAADSPVPVDIIDGDSLKPYGTTDMNDLLSATVPVL